MAFCNVTGTVLDGGGGAVRNSPVRAHLAEGDNSKFDDDGNLISDASISTTTNEVGVFSIQLIQGLNYTLDIEDANFHKKVLIPSQSSIDLKELSNG